MKEVDLSELEKAILLRSADLDVTRRRRTTVIVTGLTAALLFALVAYTKRSWQFVLAVALVYVAVTLVERVGYANAILAYKGLIQKLKARIEELEGSGGSQR